MAKSREKWQKFARQLGRNRHLSWEPGKEQVEYAKIVKLFDHLQEAEFKDLRQLAHELAGRQKIPFKLLMCATAALVGSCFRGRSLLVIRDAMQIRQTVNAVAEALTEKTSSDRSSSKWFQIDQAANMNILFVLLLLYPIAQQNWWKKR